MPGFLAVGVFLLGLDKRIRPAEIKPKIEKNERTNLNAV
jgi:hypothetical protein